MTVQEILQFIIICSLTRVAKQFSVKRIVFLTNGAETVGYHMQRIKLNHCLPPYTKIKSRWIIDLNVRVKTMKLRRKHEFWLGSDFLDMHQKLKWQKKNSKFGLHQLKVLDYFKGYYQESENTTQKVGGNICKFYIW